MGDVLKKFIFSENTGSRPTVGELSRMERHPVCMVLENIRSLYNVGSMFRTADGARLEKLYLAGYTGYPPRKEIEKSALGSTESVPWERRTDTAALLGRLREQGYHIMALEHTSGSVPYTGADYSFPLCLVLGNEVEGVTDGTLSLCDSAVEIPMYGIKESLNVAVACGIIAYHAVARWKMCGTG